MVVEEQFEFTANAKKKIFTILGVGVILAAIGMFGLANHWWGQRDAGHGHAAHEEHAAVSSENYLADAHAEGAAVHHEEAHASEGHGDHGHAEYSWTKRVIMDLWHNAVFFIGIAIAAIFFLAVNYVAWAGWSALIKRVFEAFGYYLVPGGILIIGLWFAFSHDIFHWRHEGIFETDPIVAQKEWYLTPVFYIARMFVYIGGWIALWFFIRRESKLEDLNGGTIHHNRQINWSAGYIVFFAVTSSMSSWDWIMSIDVHWFSTMFGWYVFASWFVSAICAITFVVVRLKDLGYLKQVNAEHLHDLGKFMFAFSVFWTYIWFSQFILYWYANIPEESVWFVERMFNNMGVYTPIFILNLIINFLFPFFFFMTRDSKRFGILLKVGAVSLLIGHWLDFYLMVMPGTINQYGGFDLGTLFVELGIAMVFVGVFAYSIMLGLSKAALVAKNHPMLEESIHHHT